MLYCGPKRSRGAKDPNEEAGRCCEDSGKGFTTSLGRSRLGIGMLVAGIIDVSVDEELCMSIRAGFEGLMLALPVLSEVAAVFGGWYSSGISLYTGRFLFCFIFSSLSGEANNS